MVDFHKDMDCMVRTQGDLNEAFMWLSGLGRNNALYLITMHNVEWHLQRSTREQDNNVVAVMLFRLHPPWAVYWPIGLVYRVARKESYPMPKYQQLVVIRIKTVQWDNTCASNFNSQRAL